MAQTYAAWLKAQGLTSTRKNANKWRTGQAGQAPRPVTPQAQPAPFSYASQVARDPLSIPFDSEIVWQGKGRPNLQTLGGRGGFEHLTPVQRPGGGWAAFGVPSDPTPPWMRDEAAAITARGQKTQQYAQQQVAPWLAQQLGALGAVQTQAQTGFADAISRSSSQIAAAGAQAGPGAAYAGSPALAPFASRDALGDALGTARAQTAQGAAAYQGAVDQLQGSNLGQGLSASLAQTIARMPDQWEKQRQDFMAQMAPILAQIDNNRAAGEQNRLSALEQRNQFQANNAVERKIAGLKAEADVQVAKTKADTQIARDQAKANQKGFEGQYRSVAQIRADTNQGDVLVDNQGQGFAKRPKVAKFHGKAVSWEQARDGNWYGIARAGKAGGAGGGGDSIYRSSTTRQRLASDLLTRWQGKAPAGTNPGSPGWAHLHQPGTADAAARQVALWIVGNKQFLSRGGKLRDADLREFVQSVIPDLDYSRVRYYLTRVV